MDTTTYGVNLNMVTGNPETRPALSIYHATPKNTGSALMLRAVPARCDCPGFLKVTLAEQKTRTFPTFRWESATKVNLYFDEISEVVGVLRGDQESINDGRGLVSPIGDAIVKFNLRHLIEPITGYVLQLITTKGEETDVKSIILTVAEARAILLALEGAMARICFGEPSL